MNTSSSRRILVALVLAVVLGLCGAPAQAMVVTQLDLTGGDISFDGKFHRVLDRLFDQPGTLLMGQYQPGPDIVPPITRGHRTFSLFTSGVQGALPPSTSINGSQITVDLTSLFFSISKGDRFRAWNIGGLASGSFDPNTQEFRISWEHLFQGVPFHDTGTLFLQGKATVAPIPAPATVLLFASGLAGLMGMAGKRRPNRLRSLPA